MGATHNTHSHMPANILAATSSSCHGVRAFRVKRAVYCGIEIDAVNTTWEALGASDEAKIHVETLTKDECIANATPREHCNILIDDILAVNDGLSWLGLPL